METGRTIPQISTGLVAATFTPFTNDLQIDTAAIKRYADGLKRASVAGAFINGTTGESASLTVAERKLVAESWMKADTGDMRLFVHVGHTSLPVARELAGHASEMGADAVACIAPFFFKPRNVNELVDWCSGVAEAAPGLPFYYYHIPSLSGVDVKMAELLPAAVKRIPNFAGLKFTYEDLADYRACLDFGGGHCDILFGRDEILLDSLELGGKGAVGTTYNFTAPLYHRLISAYQGGDLEKARELQKQATRMIDICVRGDWHPIAAFKWILKRVGLDCGPTRLPIPPITDEQTGILEARLAQFLDGDLLQKY